MSSSSIETIMDSKTTEFEGHKVHFWEGGNGFPIIMLHGVGPGTSIMGNFAPVLEPLAERFHIYAVDLIGFGQSDRNKKEPFFDVDLWVRQATAMLGLLPDGPVGIIGHSMGGAIALKTASLAPRFTKVMTSCSVGVSYPITDALDAFWSMPSDPADLRRTMTRMVNAGDAMTEAMIDDRWRLLNQPGYPDYFRKLFSQPRQRFLDAAVVTDAEVAAICADVMMLHGRDDQPCPPDRTTMALSQKFPAADIHLLGRCGHNLPRERTAAFLQHAFAFFGA